MVHDALCIVYCTFRAWSMARGAWRMAHGASCVCVCVSGASPSRLLCVTVCVCVLLCENMISLFIMHYNKRHCASGCFLHFVVSFISICVRLCVCMCVYVCMSVYACAIAIFILKDACVSSGLRISFPFKQWFFSCT